MDNPTRMKTDILIVGGGLVGAACAVALAEQGHQITLLDSNTPDLTPHQAWDSRIYAISPGNFAWLKKLHVWDRLNHGRICSIQGMQVWGDATAQPLEFSAYDANVADLGVILESGCLQRALWEQMNELGIHLITDAVCISLNVEQERAVLELADGRQFEARLVVAADGGNSWVRQQVDLGVDHYDYEQMGVVANFETELPHQSIARQWFREDGILAWLPLPGNRISIVWSTANKKAKYLLSLDAQTLASEVAEAGGKALGGLCTITPAAGFPLRLQTAHHLVRPRIVLVGDAAHRVHPLAGQGVNLGFRDVVALAKTLAERNAYQDIGDIVLLRRYERARKPDMLSMRYLTHGLHHLFENEQPIIKRIRDWGLQMTQRATTIKKKLVKQAII